MQIAGPSDAIVIPNVVDASVNFNGLTWEHVSGLPSPYTLLDRRNATILNPSWSGRLDS